MKGRQPAEGAAPASCLPTPAAASIPEARRKTSESAVPPSRHGHLPDPLEAAISDAVINFDYQPDSGLVRIGVVAALFAVSPATVRRWGKKGVIPAPRKLSEGVTVWSVGELRKALRGEAWQ